MKNYIIKTVVLLFVIALSSCMRIGVKGSGVIDSEFREIDNFSSIEVSGAFNVNVKFGDEYSLEVEAEDNILPLIKTYVKGNTLHIDTKRSISNRKDIEINITMPSLNSLDVSGANSIYVENMSNDSFELNSSGANNVELSGKVEKAYYNVSGACSVYAQNLDVTVAKVDISGACSLKLSVIEKIMGDLSGASHLDLYGDPKYTNIDAGYACSVNKK